MELLIFIEVLTELLIFIEVEQEDQASPTDHRTNMAKHKTDSK